MEKLYVISSNLQQLSCILIGLDFLWLGINEQCAMPPRVHKHSGLIVRCGAKYQGLIAGYLSALSFPLIPQVWLTEKDGNDQEGGGASSMEFSRSAPFSVMSAMRHSLPDEQGDSSHTPCFYMCSRTQQRLTAKILTPSRTCDYRLFVNTCKKLKYIVYFLCN